MKDLVANIFHSYMREKDIILSRKYSLSVGTYYSDDDNVFAVWSDKGIIEVAKRFVDNAKEMEPHFDKPLLAGGDGMFCPYCIYHSIMIMHSGHDICESCIYGFHHRKCNMDKSDYQCIVNHTSELYLWRLPEIKYLILHTASLLSTVLNNISLSRKEESETGEESPDSSRYSRSSKFENQAKFYVDTGSENPRILVDAGGKWVLVGSVADFLDNKYVKEKLASFIHSIWSHWMRYMRSKIEVFEGDNSNVYRVSKRYVDRWERQANTLHDDLPDNEKQSDLHLAEDLVNYMKKEGQQNENVEC